MQGSRFASTGRDCADGHDLVPIRDGISHSPQEFMSWEDCANGVEVLYRSILLLDRRLQPD